MKKTILFLLTFSALSCVTVEPSQLVATCQVEPNQPYSKAATLQALLDQYTADGLPGAAIAVYTPTEGYWSSAAGYARLEDKAPLQSCHLHYGQSVAKTYLAVVALQLAEAKQVDLDSPITRYLSPEQTVAISEAQAVTVRMLLSHTSGIPDYADNPAYVAYLLQHPLHVFSSRDYLNYIAGKSLLFTPGSRFSYSNTNYLLLSQLVDRIKGDHGRLIRDQILKPLGLQHSFYHDQPDYLINDELVNSYLDRFGDGKLENVTRMQKANVASLFGDDGIVATPVDYVRFLRGLFEGKLLTESSLRAMTTWVNSYYTGKPKYGLGLYYQEFNGQIAYGHGGGGIGAGCGLYFFPAKKVYVFIGTNVGTLLGGASARKAAELQNELLKVISN